mmetsp:Transcript_39517/g.100320  ORF Transcript_39517/g.100320 Transcript_39517/m.100320 type:complete len:238 (-) Transcript_39517:94-807(-)
MSNFGAYGNGYGGFGGGNDGGCGCGFQQQVPYPGGGGDQGQQGWWGQPYDPSGGAGQGNGWGGAGGWSGPGGYGGCGAPCSGGKDSGKGNGKSAGKAPAKGKGGKSPPVCKFFLERRCARGSACAFLHEGGPDDEDSDPDMREIHAAIAQQGKSDAAMMESLQREEERHAHSHGADSNSDAGDALPPPASEAEIEEARQIVQKAQREAVERDKMKVKAKTANRDDLQAMINARIAMK